jgi:hypothetical protein
MAFHEDEITQLELVITKALQPIQKIIDQHDQTLYGVERKNGMRKTVQELKDDMTELKSFKRAVVWASAAIGGGISTAAHLFFNLIHKP